MGLSRPALRFLIRLHRDEPLRGSVLTLGRQCVYATPESVRQIFAEEEVPVAKAPDDVPATTNIPQWYGTDREDNISDVLFFHWLGADVVKALDYSDFEGAELVADLNQPLPEQWSEQFDTIVDAGTLEHIFDVRTALINIGRLLKPGGKIVHLAPGNNYVNHGFFQFSPTLFIDYYAANRYVNLKAWVAEERLGGGVAQSLDLYAIDTDRQPLLITSGKRITTIAVAQKSATSTIDAIPMQSYYQKLLTEASHETDDMPSRSTAGITAWLRRVLPVPIKHFVRKYLMRSEYKKPWGLEKSGKLR